MEDKQIIDLYWQRSEQAIAETEKRYGRYLHAVACNVLRSGEDAEECVNDTYLAAWESMPDNRPARLAAYLGKIARNLALNRWERYKAKKRGDGQVVVALEELRDCVPSGENVEEAADALVLKEVLERFLDSISPRDRKLFMRRYWYLDSIREIAALYEIGESAVKMSLSRSRSKLKQMIEREGIGL